MTTFNTDPNSAIALTILAETPDYVVLNKPAGIVVHQSDNHQESDTLVNGLLARYPELKTVGDDPIRPGIVHRLDQSVSGVMVVARMQTMFEELKKQFQNHTIHKRYLALAHGKFSRDTGEINFSIARSSKQYTKMAARPDTTGKAAVTRYEVLKQYERYAYLQVDIETGRTHQIRVHLSAIDHPVVGEQVYLPKNFKSRLQPGRLFLHATELSFTDLAGERQTYQVPLPQELQAILDGF